MDYTKQFIDYLKYEMGLSDHTIKNYNIDLREFIDFTNNKNIKKINIDDIRDFLKQLYTLKYSTRSISRKISSLKSYFNYLESEEIIKNNPASLISNPKIEKSLPNYLNYKDLEKLLNTPDITKKQGIKEALILEMLYSSGLRVSELVNIKLKDINFNEKKILILGKGNKERYVYYGNPCEKLLNIYLEKFKPKEYLFVNNKNNKINERTIRKIVSDMAKKAEMPVHVTPHTLRHTYATHMLNEGADLKSVGDLLGHENLSTTQIYTHVSNERLRNVFLNTHPRAKKH